MFSIAKSLVASSKVRFVLTVLCIAITGMLFILFYAYLYTGNGMLQNTFVRDLAYQRIVFEDLCVNGIREERVNGEYFEVPDPLEDSMFEKLAERNDIRGISSVYLLPFDIHINIEEKEYLCVNPLGNDVRFNTFSCGLTDTLIMAEEGFQDIVSGRTFSEADHASVLLSDRLVEAIGLSAKDILGKEVLIHEHDQPVTVIGIFRKELNTRFPAEFSSSASEGMIDQGDILFSDDVLKNIADKKYGVGYDGLKPYYAIISATNRESVQEIARFVENNYQKTTISDYSVYQSQLEEQAANSRLFLILSSVAMVICLSIIISTMEANITEQKKSLHVLRILGYNGNQIRGILTAECGILGLLGGIVGVGAGFLLSLMISMNIRSMYERIGVSLVNTLFIPISHMICSLALVVIPCLLVGMIAGITSEKTLEL